MIAYRNKVQVLVSINLVLALAISLGLVFSPERSGQRSEHITILADTEVVARISIEGAEPLELIKSGSNWVMPESGSSFPAEASLPVETSRVRAFLGVLSGIDRLVSVASGRSSWAGLGLDEGQANRVGLYGQDGTLLASLSVGKYDPTGASSFLRLNPAETVYAGPSSLASYLAGGRRSWLDFRIWNRVYSAEDVQSLVLRGGLNLPDGTQLDTNYRLTRSGSAWVADQPDTRLDVQKVDGMLRSILAARSEDYLQPETYNMPALSVILLLGDGSSLELAISDEVMDERFPAVSSQRVLPLALSSWTIRDAVRPLEALLVPSP